MDLRKLKTIIELFEKSDIECLEINDAEGNVKLTKSPSNQVNASLQPSASNQLLSTQTTVGIGNEQLAISKDTLPHVDEPDFDYLVESPMVGTFYSSPSPEEAPFAKLGDNISEGQTLCIIEAMKLMNEIKADKSGKIVKIYKKNGSAVMFGEPLFAIE